MSFRSWRTSAPLRGRLFYVLSQRPRALWEQRTGAVSSTLASTSSVLVKNSQLSQNDSHFQDRRDADTCYIRDNIKYPNRTGSLRSALSATTSTVAKDDSKKDQPTKSSSGRSTANPNCENSGNIFCRKGRSGFREALALPVLDNDTIIVDDFDHLEKSASSIQLNPDPIEPHAHAEDWEIGQTVTLLPLSSDVRLGKCTARYGPPSIIRYFSLGVGNIDQTAEFRHTNIAAPFISHNSASRIPVMPAHFQRPAGPGPVLFSHLRFTFQIWKKMYTLLYFAKLTKTRISEMDEFLEPTVTAWAVHLIETGSHIHAIVARWRTLSPKERFERRLPILLWFLWRAPEMFLAVLEATIPPTDSDYLSVVCDCFIYLHKFYRGLYLREVKSVHSRSSLVYTYLGPRNYLGILPRQSVIVLFRYCTDFEALDVFDQLSRRPSQPIPPGAAAFLISRFTSMGRLDFAVQVLEYLCTQKADMSTDEILRCCTRLVMKDRERGHINTALNVTARILKCGVEPNDILNNAILTHSFKTRGSHLGREVIHHLIGQGFQPNAVTYLILLKDAVIQEDEALLENHLYTVAHDENLSKSEILLSYSMHATLTIKLQQNPYNHEDLIPRLFPIYARLHNIQPLKELGIIPHHWEPPKGSISSTDPQPSALGVMIVSYLRSLEEPQAILDLYHRFRKLVIARHPSIFRLTFKDYTYNAFIYALYRHSAYLPYSIQILEDMLAPLPPPPDHIDDQPHHSSPLPPQPEPHSIALATTATTTITPDTAQTSPQRQQQQHHQSNSDCHCKPTIFTWNILLLTFLYHNQPSSAAKIRSMMTKRGIHFNKATWELWVRGHAGMNMASKTMQALQEMEQDGFTFGIKSFQRQNGRKGMALLARLLGFSMYDQGTYRTGP